MKYEKINITNYKDGDTLIHPESDLSIEFEITNMLNADDINKVALRISVGIGSSTSGILPAQRIEKYDSAGGTWTPVTYPIQGADRLGKFRLTCQGFTPAVTNRILAGFIAISLNDNTDEILGRYINVSFKPKKIVFYMSKPIMTSTFVKEVKVDLDVDTVLGDNYKFTIEASPNYMNTTPEWFDISATLINGSYVVIPSITIEDSKPAALNIRVTVENLNYVNDITPNLKIYGMGVLWV